MKSVVLECLTTVGSRSDSTAYADLLDDIGRATVGLEVQLRLT